MYVNTKREQYNVSALLSYLGGIYSSIYLIGYTFTLAFSYNLMLSSLAKKLYHVNAKFPQERTKNNKKNA